MEYGKGHSDYKKKFVIILAFKKKIQWTFGAIQYCMQWMNNFKNNIMEPCKDA
jgi:hypothetical protein